MATFFAAKSTRKGRVAEEDLELDSFRAKIEENQEKIKLNKQLPYLVGSIVEAFVVIAVSQLQPNMSRVLEHLIAGLTTFLRKAIQALLVTKVGIVIRRTMIARMMIHEEDEYDD
ncbi:AAA ATPase [Orobanche minor]